MAKKKLLIYAHYYFPDVASTAQLYTELCEGLCERFRVTVVCVVPSYGGTVDTEYRKHRFYREEIHGVNVIRVRVCDFLKEKKTSRIKNILDYFFGAIGATFKAGRQDAVLALSQPPVLGGILGCFGKLITRGKLIYNIQDFNPEQIEAVRYSGNKPVLRAMRFFDKHSCRKADLIITVGRDMQETLKRRFAGGRIPESTVINNWADENSIRPLPKGDRDVAAFKARYGLDGKFVLMYSGNIGLYYDLSNLLKIFGQWRGDSDVAFVFVGDGAVKEKLQAYCAKENLDNVLFLPYQDKERLNVSLNAADVQLVTNAKGIKGVSVPSKIYGVMAANVPVLGILEKGSEAWRIIKQSGCGILAETGDYEGVRAALTRIVTEKQAFVKEHASGRSYLVNHFTKNRSIAAYAGAIESLFEPETALCAEASRQ